MPFTYDQYVVIELADKLYNYVIVCFCVSPWIFIQINNFSKLPALGIKPLTLALQSQHSTSTPWGTHSSEFLFYFLKGPQIVLHRIIKKTKTKKFFKRKICKLRIFWWFRCHECITSPFGICLSSTSPSKRPSGNLKTASGMIDVQQETILKQCRFQIFSSKLQHDCTDWRGWEGVLNYSKNETQFFHVLTFKQFMKYASTRGHILWMLFCHHSPFNRLEKVHTKNYFWYYEWCLL